MEAEESFDSSALISKLSQTNMNEKQERDQIKSQVDFLEEKIMEVNTNLDSSEGDSKLELDLLWHRVKTTETLITYLKSKVRMIATSLLTNTSCCIKQLDGVSLVDSSGIPSCYCSRNIYLSNFDCSETDICTLVMAQPSSLDENTSASIGELLKIGQMVTDIMENLVKRVIVAESETVIEKKKEALGQEEIKRKALQAEKMSLRLEEMEEFAMDANFILSEMRQRVEDLVEETSRQRQRATENEEELCCVKRDFESLKSFVSSLISVRETLINSEQQFQTTEELFERFVAKASQLESEKMQKEAEVRKLMEENVRLTALLYKKEAQILALNEQCKLMALGASNM